jgi:hypothetical protein
MTVMRQFGCREMTMTERGAIIAVRFEDGRQCGLS